VSDVISASRRANITVEADIEAIHVPSARASALGLVLNEILTNAIKHAYKDGRAGTLTVSTRTEESKAVIVIADYGPGIVASPPPSDGLGVTLIKRLSRQVGASVIWSQRTPGTEVILTFPVES
jgi:two-component sensor histidine kinase